MVLPFGVFPFCCLFSLTSFMWSALLSIFHVRDFISLRSATPLSLSYTGSDSSLSSKFDFDMECVSNSACSVGFLAVLLQSD